MTYSVIALIILYLIPALSHYRYSVAVYELLGTAALKPNILDSALSPFNIIKNMTNILLNNRMELDQMIVGETSEVVISPEEQFIKEQMAKVSDKKH